VALGAAGLVNLALASSLVWSELLPGRVRTGTWLAVAVLWAGSATFSRWGQRRKTARQVSSRTDDAYLEATENYLKGNWFEAECRLRELLRHEPRDLEAGLMLATLLRHTGRLAEAAQHLDRLQRLDGWERWAMEIGRERAYLAGTPEPDGGGQTADDSTEGVPTEGPQPRTAASQGAPGDRADAA
jgi:tetratricopeptide (TPR) repeat protein